MPRLPDPGDIPMVPLAPPGSWLKNYPLLLSYMIDSCWPDGEARQASKIFISVEPSGWQYTLKEPNVGLLLHVVVEVPEEGFGALEAALKGPKVPWMADPWAKRKSKKKGK